MGLSPPTLVKLLNKSDFGFDKNPDGSPRGNALGMSFWRNQRYPMVQRLPDDFDPETFEEGTTYGEEIYAITGLEHDTSQLSVRLGSPLDAVSQNAPRRLLTQDLVGALPSTGNINLN